MRPVIMVITNEIGHEALQMPLVEHDDMVEQIASAASHEPFGHAILPRTSERSPNGLDAQRFGSIDGIRATKDGVAVVNQILHCRFVGERLP